MSCRWLRLILACVFPCGSVALFCGASAAEPNRSFDLTWQVPAGCPTDADVIREINELVANSAKVPVNATIAANASIASERDGFTLTLIVRDAEGSHQRRLEAPTCEELGHAAALIVALAINPELLANQSIPSSNSPLAAPQTQPIAGLQWPEASPRPIPFSARAESPATLALPQTDAATQPLFWRLGLSAFVGFGTLPGVNLGTGLFGAIQTKSVRFELGASYLSAEVKSDVPRRGATFALYRMAPRLCWLVTETTWSAGPCAGIELGRLSGSGYGVTNVYERKALWLVSTLGALLELRIASSSLVGIFADAEVPWLSHQFDLDEIEVFRTRISGRFGISLAAGWH